MNDWRDPNAGIRRVVHLLLATWIVGGILLVLVRWVNH